MLVLFSIRRGVRARQLDDSITYWPIRGRRTDETYISIEANGSTGRRELNIIPLTFKQHRPPTGCFRSEGAYDT